MYIYGVAANLFPSLVIIAVALYATAVVLMAMCIQLTYSVRYLFSPMYYIENCAAQFYSVAHSMHPLVERYTVQFIIH
jgi:hypothetical protein